MPGVGTQPPVPAQTMASLPFSGEACPLSQQMVPYVGGLFDRLKELLDFGSSWSFSKSKLLARGS
jgi:hypothetical protein